MNPPHNFDRVAGIYRWVEYLTLGPVLQQTRTRFLPQLLHARKALVLGDGDGRFLARLLRQNPDLHAIAVDTSAAMLQRLRSRCLAASPSARDRLSLVQASALTIEPQPDTDVIVTHFFLDCLTQTEVDALAASIAARTAPGALWIVSDFGPPRVRWLRPFAAAYVRSLYLAFRILTGLRITRLPDPQAALSGAGFHLLGRHERLLGLIYTEMWQRT
jgi:SAM-dependent methyltransferase